MPKGVYKRKPEMKTGKNPNSHFKKGENNPMYGVNRQGKENPMYGVHRFGKESPMWGKTHSEKSIQQMKRAQRKEKNHQWKGEKYQNKEGRWFIWLKDKTVCQSRYVAEQYLKRPLNKEEVIHHIDENKSNDNPINLYLFASRGKHIGFHNLKNKPILKSNLF